MSEAERLWLTDRQVDLVTRDVLRAGEEPVRLTTKEAALLAYLAARAGRDVPREDLLSEVWGYAPTARTRAVDFTVRRLRQKVEPDPAAPVHVCTVKGVGYRFEAGEGPAVAPAPVAPGTLRLPPAPPVSDAHADAEAVARVRERLEGPARVVTLIAGPGVAAAAVAAAAVSEAGAEVGWIEAAEDLDAALEALLEGPGDEAALVRALRGAGAVRLVLVGLDRDAAAAARLARLLRGAPDLRILAVSPSRLGLAGEHLLTLRARGQAVDLAILDEVWASLDAGTSAAWAALSVAEGPIDLASAQARIGVDPLDAIEALGDRGLLQSVPGAQAGVVALTPAARTYGRQRLGSEAAARIAEHRRDVVAGLWPLASGAADDAAGGARWAADLSACWEDRDQAPRRAARAAVLLALLAPDDEAASRLVEAEPLAAAEDRGSLLRARGAVRLEHGQPEAAHADAAAALAEARESGSLADGARACLLLARAARRLGRLPEARAAAERAADGFLAAGRSAGVATARTLQADLAHELGEPDTADALLRDAVHRARLAGEPVVLATALTRLGTLLRHRGHLAAAAEAYDEADAVLAGASAVAAARLDLERALLDLERGETDRARDRAATAREHLDALGHPRDAAEAALAVGTSLWHAGEAAEAVDLLDEAREGFARAGDRLHRGLALAWCAAAAAGLGALDDATAWLAEATAVLEPLALRRGDEVLRACVAHLDRARGGDLSEARAWAAVVESRDDAWGDVREALRLLL